MSSACSVVLVCSVGLDKYMQQLFSIRVVGRKKYRLVCCIRNDKNMIVEVGQGLHIIAVGEGTRWNFREGDLFG